MKFDFDKKPGKLLNTKEYEEVVPIISIIFPIINNDKMNINSINSILNQTYPNFELIIIGNYNEYKLNDKRIKLIDKVYDNIFDAYNYGEKNVNQESKYLVFFKEGDLMETTYLETTYWSLITHSKASWAYSNAVVYGEKSIENKLFDEYYSPQKLNSNLLFMIRREAFEEINGFQSNADYAVGFSIFWKNLIKKGMAPVHSTWYLNWMSYQNYNSYYNVKKHINVEYEESRNKGVQFPFFKYNYEEIDFENENLVKVKQKKNNKINILMIVPWIIIGGADIFNLELIKRLDKNKYTFTLISTEPAINNLRQKIENIADVYDITSFIECKDYISFIKYIMEKNNINMIFNTSSFFGYSILPYLKGMYPQIPIVDYIHMEEWYNRNGGYARSSSMLEGIIDKTLVCNSVTEEILVNYFKRKDNEVETVYIGVDTEKFNPDKYDKMQLRKKYGLENNNKIIIGYICRISEQKRPMLLAEIIKKTISRRKDVLFLIVGDGSMLKNLKEALKMKKLQENIKFLPSTNKTPEMYRISDITINCSIKEGLALTAYESLSMGVPVISADVGGQRELVGDDVGKLVPSYQNEKEIYKFNYTDKEINNYVEAIDDVISRLDKVKLNCRKKILNRFTLEQMAQNMDKQFDYIYNNPNKDKIKMGLALNKSIGITKELIIASMFEDKDKTIYQSSNFFEKVYSKDVKKVKKLKVAKKLKEKLWNFKLWRKFTQSKVWKFFRKIVRRG
jgi:glycosyltransferase involved in cell wall biosynthesis